MYICVLGNGLGADIHYSYNPHKCIGNTAKSNEIIIIPFYGRGNRFREKDEIALVNRGSKNGISICLTTKLSLRGKFLSRF